MPTKAVTPMKFMNDLWAARVSLTLAAAVELNVFTLISQGKKTAADLSKALNAPQRGVERLLDALVAMEYLTKRGNGVALTSVADTFLVSTKHTFIGGMADESRMTLPGWMNLAEVIRSGSPQTAVDTAEGREFFPRLVRAIFPMTFVAARGLVEAFPKAK